MGLKPLRDRVVVKPIEKEEMTKSGIVLPETAKEKPQEGKVIAVGSGRINSEGKTIPLEVKVGDKVIYSKYGGSEVKIDDEEYLILREDDILAIVKK
jgi:chaperonin GroES